MAFRIMPHGRLQEWVAEERGYFAAEGLESIFISGDSDYGTHSADRDSAGEVRTGAFETFGAGRDGANVSCACHWATNTAASQREGQLVTTAYSVAPCAIVVPPESPVRRPEDLAGVAVGVGYHSGSHFAALQALEAVLPPDQINLTFQGPPNERLDALLERRVPAATAWGVPLYIAEAFGFRKVIDATFMIATMIHGNPDAEDLRKYFKALRWAQRDIDLRHDRYTHYYTREFPQRWHAVMDTRRWGPGERLVFEPYTRETFDETFRWIAERGIFADTGMGLGKYESAIATVAS